MKSKSQCLIHRRGRKSDTPPEKRTWIIHYSSNDLSKYVTGKREIYLEFILSTKIDQSINILFYHFWKNLDTHILLQLFTHLLV
jgi:hypothetical protein